MTPNALARHLFTTYEHYRVDHLTPAHCKHGVIVAELSELVGRSNGRLTMTEVGQSLEGRSLFLVTCGSGEKRILLWSQMHGDEPTATLALMDMLNFLTTPAADEPWVREMLQSTTLYFLPMLNPDGAERGQRRTAAGIDMNRDAGVLRTPEARALRSVHRKVVPAFSFNLHDQEISTVGETGAVAALSLLAPALDEKKTTPNVRLRAKRVAALIVRSLHQFVEGHIAGYNDEFEPRAFGDSMQLWGTSTVLIESGHWPKDRDKKFIRKLNYVAILSALRAIGNGSYQDVDLDFYTHLKPNGKRIYDIIIDKITVEHESGWSGIVDMGLVLEASRNLGSTVPIATIKEIGDLSTFASLQRVDAHGRTLKSSQFVVDQVLPLNTLFDALQIYQPLT
jgi:hypothetical protein